MPCQRIELRTADQPRLVADAAARLRRGELLVLPTETVYGLTVLPSDEAAVARARTLKGRDGAQPFTWHIADRPDFARLALDPPAGIVRLVERYWPGPLTVIVPARGGGTCGVRLPAHDFTRAVIRAAGEPLWMSSVNQTGEPPLLAADAIAARYGEQLGLVVDDGPSPLGMASTIVRAEGRRLDVLREGILLRDEVLHTAADTILFVCSGNTCRSPLAAALARELTARTLGVPADQVLAHGFAFASAGTSTIHGLPASEGSLLAGRELDLDLTAHASQPIDVDLVTRADRIYCLGRGHRRALLAEWPELAPRTALLRPDGLDIGDPYGGDLATYRRARDEIRAAVGARLTEWLPKAK